MLDYLYPDWKTQEPEAPIASKVFPSSVITDAQLADAVMQALKAPRTHRMSPSWAVKAIYEETMKFGRTDADWAMYILDMKPNDYSIRWDVSMDVWNSGGAVEFSGREIAHMCAYWIAKGFDFEKHNIEQLPEFGRQEGLSEETDSSSWEGPVEEQGTVDFPLPLDETVVRYVWLQERDGHVFLRSLKICLAGCGKYEFVVEEEGNSELIAYSEQPLDRHLLELRLYAGLLPVTASAPYIV